MPEPLKIIITLICGYFIGCINPAFIIGRLRGYDIREEGSGNAGASNVVILVGKRAGLFVALFDIIKSACAWWLPALIFPELRYLAPLGAVACIIGHMYPVFMHFRGGKGLACLGGAMLAYDPKTLLALLGLALLIAVITNYICIVTVSMGFIIPVYYGIQTAYLPGAFILAIPAIPILVKHLVNFRRISEGKELRMSALFFENRELARIGIDEEESKQIKSNLRK